MPGQAEVQPYHHSLHKILVVGGPSTGKTALIRRSVHGVYYETQRPTIGVDFALKSVDRPDGEHVLQLWDIAGQDQVPRMTRPYYQAAEGALVACDITRPDSFDDAVRWKADIDSKVFIGPAGSTTRIPCILLVNKCDLGPLHMTRAELDAFCQHHGFVAWFLTSAKNRVNVGEPFDAIADHVTSALRSIGCQVPVQPRPFPGPKPNKGDGCSC